MGTVASFSEEPGEHIHGDRICSPSEAACSWISRISILGKRSTSTEALVGAVRAGTAAIRISLYNSSSCFGLGTIAVGVTVLARWMISPLTEPIPQDKIRGLVMGSRLAYFARCASGLAQRTIRMSPPEYIEHRAEAVWTQPMDWIRERSADALKITKWLVPQRRVWRQCPRQNRGRNVRASIRQCQNSFVEQCQREVAVEFTIGAEGVTIISRGFVHKRKLKDRFAPRAISISVCDGTYEASSV